MKTIIRSDGGRSFFTEDERLNIEIYLDDNGTFGVTVRATGIGDTLDVRYNQHTHYSHSLYGSVQARDTGAFDVT